jgi:hypothetical protein
MIGPSRLARRALAFVISTGACAGAFACTKGPREPVAPPAQTAPSATPRFDGVYAAKVEGKGGGAAALQGGGGTTGIDLLRFTKDGKVQSLSVSSAAALEGAVKSLLAGTDKAAVGTYEVKEGVLRFTLTSKLGSVEYAGGVKEDQLSVRWHSAINDATVEESFQFVKVETDGDKADDKIDKAPGADGADGGAPSAPGTSPPDAALIPQGKGWACFRAPTMNTSRCERTMSACEAAYKEASTARADLKLTKCAKRPSAYCHTVQRRGAGRGSGFCYQGDDECKAGASGFEGGELVISSCGKF